MKKELKKEGEMGEGKREDKGLGDGKAEEEEGKGR